MKKLHIANVNFEHLLECNFNGTLEESMLLHPLFQQLQFLPPLYTDDPFLTTECETLYKGRQYSLSSPPKGDYTVVPWGHSPLIQEWANLHGFHYSMPDSTIVSKIASKRFTFEECPKLPGAKILASPKDLSFDYSPIVVKTEFGFSGRGMKIYESLSTPDEFITAEWRKGRILIAEPWVKVVMNFSSQYLIENGEIQKLGTNPCLSTRRGGYLATLVGSSIPVEAQRIHDKACQQILQSVYDLGYFGPIGVDGFIWEGGVHPVVEINPRKTMSYVAMQYAGKSKLQFIWKRRQHSPTNLLPCQLKCRNNDIVFPMALHADSTETLL